MIFFCLSGYFTSFVELFSNFVICSQLDIYVKWYRLIRLANSCWFKFGFWNRFLGCIEYASLLLVNQQTKQQTTVLRLFVRDYPGEAVPEETLTHPPSWSSSNLYQLLPSTTIHSILTVQITCLLSNLFAQPLSMSCLVYLLVWSPPPHIPYVSSPSQRLFFAAHADTITTCFAVVSILYRLFLVNQYHNIVNFCHFGVSLFMAALCNRGAIIFLPCSFFFLSFFFYLLLFFFLA